MMRFNHNFTSDDEVRGLLSAMVPGVARIKAEYWLRLVVSLFVTFDQHKHHEHYIDIVESKFNFYSGKSVDGFKFTVNSNEVRMSLLWLKYSFLVVRACRHTHWWLCVCRR